VIFVAQRRITKADSLENASHCQPFSDNYSAHFSSLKIVRTIGKVVLATQVITPQRTRQLPVATPDLTITALTAYSISLLQLVMASEARRSIGHAEQSAQSC
jgi:hypothetical protein